MAKGYLSNRQKNLKVGISSYTENSTVLEVAGKVGIGTTNATSNLHVVGETLTTSLSVTNGATINGLTYPTSDGTNLQVLSTDGNGGLSFQSLTALSGFGWGNDTDLGLITDSVTITSDSGLITESIAVAYDLGLIVTSGIIYPDQFVLPLFTVSTLPSASPAGQMLFVTDETGGSVPAFSDGTNWRRLTDRAIVS